MNVTANEIGNAVRNAFGFSVDKFPLSGPEGMATRFYGLFRSDNSANVGNAVSQGYVPHTTEDVVALAEAAANVFSGDVKLTCHWQDGHYVTVAPTNEARRDIARNDGVFPRLVVGAGYDGKPFSATIGMFRDLCTNLVMLRSVNETTVRIRHTQGLRGRMDELIDVFSGLRRGWESVTTVAAEMESRRVRLADFLDSVYGTPVDSDSKAKVTNHTNRTAAIFRRVEKELRAREESFGEGYEVSAWLAYNAVQGYVQHDQRRHGKPTAFDRMLMASRSTDVQQAERLALAT